MSFIDRRTTPLLLLAVLAACGDDTSSTSSGGGGGSGGGATTTSSGGSTTPATTTAASGGGGQGGGGGERSVSCDDDAAICEERIAQGERCGLTPADNAQAECESYALCERRLYRDDLECDLYTCMVEVETCDATCEAVIAAIEPSAIGQSFIDACPEVMLPCQEEATELYCDTFGRALADDILEGFVACLEADSCQDAKDCFDEVIIANPECPDL